MNLQNTPTGIVFDSDGTSGIYYQDTSGNWFRDIFNNQGIFLEAEPLTLSNVLTDESTYNIDLNYDSHVGGIISSIITDNQNFALYKISSGAYVTDDSGLKIGDLTSDPTLLIQQTVSKGNVKSSLYELYSPITGAVSYAEGGFGVYYRDGSGSWKRDNFDTNGVFKQTDSYSFTELLADEAHIMLIWIRMDRLEM